jgi:hypothetical protein
MHKPRFPLRWRHRVFRMLMPRSLLGLSIQLVLATGVLIAALCWTDSLASIGALLVRWFG